MRFISTALAVATVICSTSVSAQHGRNPEQDPVRAKYSASRQRAGETKAAEAKRNTRCKIEVRKGQDRHVCGVPTNMSPGDGRKR